MNEAMIFEKEMWIPIEEFHRIFGRFLRIRDHTMDGMTITVPNIGDGALTVTLVELEAVKMSSLISRPRLAITFAFDGVTSDVADQTMDIIDRHFQRGGG